MRGGKRPGAGRRPGPNKIRLIVYVLASTARRLNKIALHKKSLGAALDELLPAEK
jgi:hypothetical protein